MVIINWLMTNLAFSRKIQIRRHYIPPDLWICTPIVFVTMGHNVPFSQVAVLAKLLVTALLFSVAWGPLICVWLGQVYNRDFSS